MILSNQQFDRRRRLASSLAGIELVDRHRELLSARRRFAALERMVALLASDGLLMLDSTENHGRAGRCFSSGTNGVYSLRSDSGKTGIQTATPVRMHS